MRVLMVVTHLLGTGHLARALTLARAFAARGHDVRVASGGVPAPHLSQPGDPPIVQLPALRSAGTDFTRLLAETGDAADPALYAARDAALRALVQDFRPDCIITELFPFGRRILKAEFERLLDVAQGLETPPLVVSSVRDILAPPSKPAKVAYAEAILDQYYDAVLVHSDPAVVPLTASWPVSAKVARKLHYTGFVAVPAPVSLPDAPKGEILVSAGGGEVGETIFDAALRAARMDQTRHWRLFVPGDARERLAEEAPGNVRVSAPDPDFRRRLLSAGASVSMCGYNTALDLLHSGVPAVLIPFDADGETEQGLRAEALSERSGIVTLWADDLSGEALLLALDCAQAMPRRPVQTEGMQGADRSVDIVEALQKVRSA